MTTNGDPVAREVLRRTKGLKPNQRLIMQLYANRLSYAVQAGFIKYESGADVLDASREATVIASAEANAVANGLPSYVGSVMYGNYCMLYVSKRLEVETLNAAFNANLTLPVQHAD